MGKRRILSKERDLRLVTIRRGGTLSDEHHRLLTLWAADCAAHVLHHFESARPGDDRTRQTIELARAWGRAEITMTQARRASFAAKASRDVTGAARYAALSASQAVVVSHVAAHELGAAAYAILAASAAAPEAEQEEARRRECTWQRGQLPREICALVLDDQARRNALCWHVFDP